MKRLHLIEIEDQSWCPRFLRDALTDYLHFSIERMKIYAPVVPRLGDALARLGVSRLVDLCSGAGGPWRALLPELEERLGRRLEVRLSDYYPNREALERMRESSGGRIDFEPEPVDATHVPERLTGLRTLFNAFHHFRPQAAREILRDAVRQRQGVAVFEFTQRRWAAILSMPLSLLAVFFVTPLIRPFRLSRLLATYLVPMIPVTVLFDGVVSCLRTYTPDELRGLVEELGTTDYHWEIGEDPIPRSPIAMTWLIGYPKNAAQLGANGLA
jgi:hypothetical protein